MSVSATSARRATFDAIALAIAFLAVDAVIVFGMLADWIDVGDGVLTVLALAAVVLLLYRDDVAEAISSSNQKLGLAADDEFVRHALDELEQDGWTVDQDVANARGALIGTLVQGPSGAYIVQVRNRAYRLEHLRRARRDAARLHGGVGGWVQPVLCLALRDDEPHRRNGVWIMGAEHLADWLRQRTAPRGNAPAA